jgi:hypothetical protein
MSDDVKEQKDLEDNLPMVNYIMLHRIYDVLTLIAKNTSSDQGDEVSKLIAYHDQGYLLGPVPSFTAEKEQ